MEITVPADTYLSYILSRPLPDVWKIFLLGMARIVPAIAFAPFLGGKLLPDSLKIGLGGAITFIFLPFLVIHQTEPINFDILFMLLLVKEAFIGFLLGFLIAIPFFYCQAAGATIDHQRGSQSLQVMDPSTQMQTSPTGTLFNSLMLIIFFTVGGPLFFFEAIFTSFSVLPFDQFFPANFFDGSRPLWVASIDLLNIAFSIGLQLAAPALIAILLSDLFLGIVNRMAPQVQISFLLYSLKSYSGVGMLWIGWWFVLKQFDVEAVSWVKFFTNLVSKL
ncbi:MAG: Surface presentation of antigens protein SpaR [Chlamydiales bacterium]|nr:Surface presentation of antigens protein SpaR [Chlamydiales bacterium]